MLTWNEIAAAHFREKVATHHKLGPLSGKSLSSGPPMKKSKVESENQDGLKSESTKTVEIASVPFKHPSSSSVGERSNPSAIQISASNISSSNKPAAPTSMQMPSWAPAPCPMGPQTPDVITEIDMKNVLQKYNTDHPKCNAALHDTTLLGKSFVRGAVFGLGYSHGGKSV